MSSDITLSRAVRSNLLSLQNTATMMDKTQGRLATGNKVNSALDNPSNFFTASALNSRAGDMANLLDSMASGIKTIEAASNGITALTKNLESMQSTLRQARQDKSFQTQSFEVTDASVLNIGGGQFTDGKSIKLTDKVDGVKAQITTNSTSAYLGPKITAGAEAGVGARSVITTNGAIATGETFKVAGVDIVAGADVTDGGLAATIQTTLDASAQAGKYKVSVGTGDNAGSIVVETVNTSAEAAKVEFLDADSAKKGSTTFNYSAVSSSLQVGGETINTGANFAEFVKNLEAGQEAGKYSVKVDATTKQITLTNTEFGGTAPVVTGVPTYSAGAPASKATTTFQLASTGTAATKATTTFQIANNGTVPNSAQNLTIAGKNIAVTTAMSNTDLQQAIEADVDIAAAYDVAVDATFNVTLTAKVAGAAAAPAVTTDRTLVAVTASQISGASGATLVGPDPDLSSFNGTSFSLDDGAGNTFSYTFSNNTTGQLAAINAGPPGSGANGAGFTVSIGAQGLNFSRADGRNFTITVPNSATGTGLGLGSTTTTTSTNGVMAQPNGIVGGNAAVVTTAGTAAIAGADLDDNQTVTIAGKAIALTDTMTSTQVRDAIVADADINAAYDVTVDTNFNVTLTAKTAGVAAAPTAASSQLATPATTATLAGVGGTDLTGDPNLSAYNGSTITLTSPSGKTSSYTFDNTTTGQAADLETALEVQGYNIQRTANGLSISRADGENFTLSTTGGVGGLVGLPGSVSSTDGVMAKAAGIVGGNAAVVTTAGAAATAEVNGIVETAPVVGASVATVGPETDDFTVSYDGKTASIKITGVAGGGVPTNALDVKNWQDATIASVNTQLEKAGITGVEAKFDEDGKFSLVAKSAEAKTLAVSGTDSVALFGTDGVDTGTAAVSGLNATKTVDKFVELINRDYAGKIRASNDNGKLRIENLSTQALDIGVDTKGNGAITQLKVDGNTVRANLSKQFNELRDQLDKLSDDASFNGINLLRGDKLKITFNESGSSSIDIQAKDQDGNVRSINAANLNIDTLVAEDLDTDEAIDGFLNKLASALTELRSQASTFGSNLSSVENRQSFTKNMINTLETGAANLTLADTNEEAANLLALQTRQSLSSSALSMASQQDQAVLQLLR